jgi:hypothetical protein
MAFSFILGVNHSINIMVDILSLSLSLSLSLFPVAPTFEHRASVKCFVSLQFLNPKTVGWTPWTGINPSQGRYIHRTT